MSEDNWLKVFGKMLEEAGYHQSSEREWQKIYS